MAASSEEPPTPATMETEIATTVPLDTDAAPKHETLLQPEHVMMIRSNDKYGLARVFDEKPELINTVDEKTNASAAHWAALEGHMVILEDLCARGANLDLPSPKNGMTPLHYACHAGNLQVAQFLVNQAGCAPEACDFTGATPLMLASQNNWPRLVFWLAKLKPELLTHADKDGDDALLWAAYKGSLSTLSLLCELGMDPHKTDKYGSNALHLSVARNCEPNVRFLLQRSDKDALMAAKDSKDRTPLMIAEEKVSEAPAARGPAAWPSSSLRPLCLPLPASAHALWLSTHTPRFPRRAAVACRRALPSLPSTSRCMCGC